MFNQSQFLMVNLQPFGLANPAFPGPTFSFWFFNAHSLTLQRIFPGALVLTTWVP